MKSKRKNKSIAWLCLIVSGLSELIWAYTMKLSHGFTVLWPSVITVAVLSLSFFLLAKAVKEFGIGMSYAVFTGIGVVGTSLVGIFVLEESVNALKIASLVLLIAGIIGLKLCGGEEDAK